MFAEPSKARGQTCKSTERPTSSAATAAAASKSGKATAEGLIHMMNLESAPQSRIFSRLHREDRNNRLEREPMAGGNGIPVSQFVVIVQGVCAQDGDRP